jgi:hypothetical protein
MSLDIFYMFSFFFSSNNFRILRCQVIYLWHHLQRCCNYFKLRLIGRERNDLENVLKEQSLSKLRYWPGICLRDILWIARDLKRTWKYYHLRWLPRRVCCYFKFLYSSIPVSFIFCLSYPLIVSIAVLLFFLLLNVDFSLYSFFK